MAPVASWLLGFVASLALAEHHAGVREGSPGAGLRLRLTLPNIDAAFRQRLNLQLSMPSTAAAECPATAGAGKRARRAQDADENCSAEQDDLAAQHHAGIRQGSPIASLRLRPTKPL